MANDDDQYLRECARSGTEAAFRELVDRHVNTVYLAALREADGDDHLAEE
jgi:hypothetical protein